MPQGATFKVPRLYKAAAKISATIKNENGNLAQLVEQYNKKTNTKALAALVSKIIKDEDLLDKIIDSSQILTKEPKEDPWLLRVLIAELLLGKQRLPIGSKSIQTVLSYGPTLRTELMKAQGKHMGKQKKSKPNSSISESFKIEEPENTEYIGSQEDIGKKSRKRKHNIKSSMEENSDNLQSKPASNNSQKRKKGDIQTTEEEDTTNDNLVYKPKKLKKSKNKEKIINDASEEHTSNESIESDESKTTCDYSKLPVSVTLPTEHKRTKKKGKKYTQLSDNSVHKKKSSNFKTKSVSEKIKKKKFKRSSHVN